MAVLKLSAKSTETIEYLEAVLKEADHFAALVEQYAAAKKGGDAYATQVSRELGQLRQKAMARNLGFIADAAGQLGVMASRGGSPMMKARVLRDGVASFRALVERTIKATITADESGQKEKAYQAEKAMKAQVEAVKARVLAEEAKEAAKAAAVVLAQPAAAAPEPAAPKPAAAPAPAAAKPAAAPTTAPASAGAPQAGPPPAAPAPAPSKPAAAPQVPAAPARAPKAPASPPPPAAPDKPRAAEPVPTKPQN